MNHPVCYSVLVFQKGWKTPDLMSTFAKHNVNNATSTPAQIDRDYEFWDCPLLYLENKYQIALDLLNTCAKQNLNDTASPPQG